MYGVVAMIPYIVGAALFVFLAARTREKAPFYLYMAAILCGLVGPGQGAGGAGAAGDRVRDLPGVHRQLAAAGEGAAPLRPLVAALALVVVAVPWHHAMLIRHGAPFWDELFGDNHWRRMVIGRHGDRGTFEYFLRELGYGFSPGWRSPPPRSAGR